MTPDKASQPEGSLERVGEALEKTAEEGSAAARRLQEVFALAADDIEASLTAAARAGEISMKTMVQEILKSLALLAAQEFIIKPLEEFFSQGAGDLSSVFAGRADGGSVAAGRAYLVGERGPEVFTPASAGAVTPMSGAPPVQVTIIAQGATAEAVRRSEGQISAVIARAARRGSAQL